MCYLREFRNFVAVYEEKSFTKAADRMNATQSGISQNIKRIEEAMGLCLFDRSTRIVKPTLQGDLYYLHCQKLLQEYDEVIHELQGRSGDTASEFMSIGVVPWLKLAVLASYTPVHHGLTLTVEEASSDVLEARLQEGSLDFIVTEKKSDIGDSESVSSQCVLVTSQHEPRCSRDITPKDISALNLILPPKGHPLRRAADQMFAENRIKPAKLIEVNSLSAAVNLAAQSSWSALVPSVALIGEPVVKSCVVDRILGGPRIDVMIKHRRRAQSPSENILHKRLIEAFTRCSLDTQFFLKGNTEPANNVPHLMHSPLTPHRLYIRGTSVSVLS